ncbi:MAG: adenosine deaminase [Caldilineales bacterium]
MSQQTFIQQMPKAELHIHLEGAIEPATLLRLAERNRVALPANSLDGLRAWYQFSDFPHFVDVYMAIQSCLRSADDFATIAYELGADMARQNILYREATVTPYTHLIQGKGLHAEDIIAGLEDGRQRARRDFGVEMRWILDIHRNLDMPATAEVTTQLVLDWADRGVVALGLGGNEATSPALQFAPYFERVKAAGLGSAPHAGEVAGPESVWAAVRELQADRIGHGVRSIEDPHLLAYLHDQQITLEVNPTSNVCLKVYRSIDQHPFIHLLRMGLNVTVNSDDPPLFNTTLTQEFDKLTDTFALTADDLHSLSLNALRSSFLTTEARRPIEARMTAMFADLAA